MKTFQGFQWDTKAFLCEFVIILLLVIVYLVLFINIPLFTPLFHSERPYTPSISLSLSPSVSLQLLLRPSFSGSVSHSVDYHFCFSIHVHASFCQSPFLWQQLIHHSNLVSRKSLDLDSPSSPLLTKRTVGLCDAAIIGYMDLWENIVIIILLKCVFGNVPPSFIGSCY